MRHQPSVFEQTIKVFPWQQFASIARAHDGGGRQRGFSSHDHFLCLLAGALGGQQGLRATVTTLAPNQGLLRLLGVQPPARSTLADANRQRPAAFFLDLFSAVARLAAGSAKSELREAIRLVDSTHLPLGKRMQAWFGLHKGKVGAKMHVVFDPRADRPVFFALSAARLNDNTAAKCLLPIEPGATYVFDRGYHDYTWWSRLDNAGCRIVTRLRSPTKLRDVEPQPVPPGSNVLADEIGEMPQRLAASRRNPFRSRGRVVTVHSETGKPLRLFTNDLDSPASEIAALYKERWQIELFFKWIKQNLRITRFMGTSENAIRIQIAVALIAYVLIRLLQRAQTTPQHAIHVLRIVQTHLFVRRALQSLIDPKQTPPPRYGHIGQISLCI